MGVSGSCTAEEKARRLDRVRRRGGDARQISEITHRHSAMPHARDADASAVKKAIDFGSVDFMTSCSYHCQYERTA